jgi:hypothetical protein
MAKRQSSKFEARKSITKYSFYLEEKLCPIVWPEISLLLFSQNSPLPSHHTFDKIVGISKCGLCRRPELEDTIHQDGLLLLPCQHYFCRNCLYQYVILKLGQGSPAVKCPVRKLASFRFSREFCPNQAPNNGFMHRMYLVYIYDKRRTAVKTSSIHYLYRMHYGMIAHRLEQHLIMR